MSDKNGDGGCDDITSRHWALKNVRSSISYVIFILPQFKKVMTVLLAIVQTILKFEEKDISRKILLIKKWGRI